MEILKYVRYHVVFGKASDFSRNKQPPSTYGNAEIRISCWDLITEDLKAQIQLLNRKT